MPDEDAPVNGEQPTASEPEKKSFAAGGAAVEGTSSSPQPVALSAHDKKRIVIGFCVSFAIFLLSGAFYFWRIPPGGPLYIVPQVLLLLAGVVPILLWQTLASRSVATKVSTISSVAIWIIGIAVAFLFKPDSPFIALSDGFLLLGFVPLLYLWRFSVPWIIFGAFNGAIGIFLLLLSLLADSYFPVTLWGPKHHLSQYHPYMAWLLFGFVTFVYGIVRLIKNIYGMSRKAKKSR